MIRPDLDQELEAIVMRCLHKEREDRYPDVRALATDLLTYLDRNSLDRVSLTRARPADKDGSLTPFAGEYTVEPERRHPRAARNLGMVGIGATVLLAGYALAMAFMSETGSRPPELTLPGDPALLPGPAAQPLQPETTGAADVAATATGAQITVAPARATAEPAVPVTPPAVNTAAPSSLAQTAAPPTVAPSATARPSTPAVEAPAKPQTQRTAPPRAPSNGPALTPEEIERRKSRYENWLKEQGLQRLDQAAETTRHELLTDSPYGSE
jgi:hypothetical protein